MITVDEARDLAGSRLKARLGEWASRQHDNPVFTLSLKPPSEKEMLTDQGAAERWARAWSESDLPSGAETDWEFRTWRSIGRQNIPVRLRVATPDAMAAFAGGSKAREWKLLASRAELVRARFGETDDIASVIRRHTDLLLHLDNRTFSEIVQVAQWLTVNGVNGMRPRQLPIRGVDTKWFSSHRALVTALHDASTGSLGLGIRDSDPLVRVRVLDDGLAMGGLRDFAAPASELTELDYSPRVVFILENLESVLAMPEWEGAIVIHGSGYAVDVVGRLGWVQRSPVIYCGDLDSHGFAILHRLRRAHESVTSVLMDEATLITYRDLWVPEPKPNRGTFDTLSPSEQGALRRLRDEGDVRLEQERIPWATALGALVAAS